MRILAVVVRYNMPLDASETLRGLCAALRAEPALAEAYKVLVWDNSPEPLTDPQLPIPFEYRHSGRNLGVSGAYNHAMEYAEQHGFPWMLLLDQDSAINGEFLQTMYKHAEQLQGSREIAAIAPTVRAGGNIASPRRQLFGRNTGYPEGESGVAPGEAIAINSGCVLRVSSLRAIGGFSLDFWLDYSDLYVFHLLHRAGFKVWRAADAILEHEMTVMDYDRLMSPWRYRNFSYAETAFFDLYRTRTERLIHHLRLFVRAIRQRRRFKNPVFSKIAWAQFTYRVRHRRAKRLSLWRRACDERLGVGAAGNNRTTP